MLSTPSPALNEKGAPLVTAVTKKDKIKPVGWFLKKKILREREVLHFSRMSCAIDLNY